MKRSLNIFRQSLPQFHHNYDHIVSHPVLQHLILTKSTNLLHIQADMDSPQPISFDSSPTEYYQHIRKSIKESRHHIILSALYFGNDTFELDILKDLDAALAEHPSLTVTMILDHSRSTRLVGGSIDILQPLVRAHYPRFHVNLYQMPSSRGYFMHQLPSAIRETFGVYHAKFCVFDHKVILTGANLSQEYFNTRLDRYMTTHDKNIHDYLGAFSSIVSSFSHQIDCHGHIISPISMKDDELKIALMMLSKESTISDKQDRLPATIISSYHPVLQHASIGITQEQDVIIRFFSSLSAYIHYTLISSPYPSFRPDLIRALSSASTSLSILSASLRTHGFASGKGLKSLIPKLHQHYISNVVSKLSSILSYPNSLLILLFNKPGWTFHTKGIWAQLRDDAGDEANAVYIGSSNFGQRSWTRDFELGVMILTEDIAMKKVFADEVHQLTENKATEKSATFDVDDKKTWFERLVLPILTYMFKSFL